MTKLLLFKCIDNHDNNSNTNLVEGMDDTGSSNVKIKNSFMQDFDYNTIDISDLGRMKMPYINCNQKIFTDSDKDLIDIFLLDKKSQALFHRATNTFKFKIENVKRSIAILLDVRNRNETKLLSEVNSTSENLLGVEINSSTRRGLNDELVKFNEALKHLDTIPINRMLVQTLLESIDNYIFKDLKYSNLFLNRLKPSIIFSKSYDKEFLDLKEAIHILTKIVDTYKKLWKCTENISLTISELESLNLPKGIFTSSVYINNVFIKWYVELNTRETHFKLKSLNKTDRYISDQIIVYSNNADPIVEELSQAIKLIVNEASEEALNGLNIQKVLIANELFHTSIFNSYEIGIHNKKYLIKKFFKKHTFSFPTGLSTTYLNANGGFTSIGYMGFENLSDISKNCFFLSVEEKMDDFFRTDNFEIFKENEDQVFWFILDFLHILDRLISCKIKLTSSTLLFAVKKDNERWRFRVDDIGYFEYYIYESEYENHTFLINIFTLICSTIKNQSICEYINLLIEFANGIKDSELTYYIEMIITVVNQKLGRI